MSITPNSPRVRSGEALTLTVQVPADRQLINGIRIYQDLTFDDEGQPVIAGPYLSQIPIASELDEAGLGGTFNKTIDTLFFEPGNYTFLTYGFGPGEAIWCIVEVLAPSSAIKTNILGDFATGSARWRLYDNTGNRIHPSSTNGLPTLETSKVYYWGLNLSNLTGISKQIDADFYTESGERLLYRNMLTIYTFPHLSRYEDISFSGHCAGVDASSFQQLQSVHIIPFKTPEHLDYYEYDGILRFSLDIKTGSSCQVERLSMDIFLDDGPALAAIPTYHEYLEEQYPDSHRNRRKYPLDRRNFRLVRIGNYNVFEENELLVEAKKLAKAFISATKGYFYLNVQGVEHVNWESHKQLFIRVKNWYEQLPKSSEGPVLQWSDERQRHLIFFMFMNDHTAENSTILRQLYSPGSKGEDFTMYFADGITELGQGMGADGFMVLGLRMFHRHNFYTFDTEGNRLHKMDFDLYIQNSDGTFDTFWEHYKTTRFYTNYLNTSIHEMGHTFWLPRIGLTFGDQSERRLPFYSHPSMIDASFGYFTRNEFMSYGRDRSDLFGQTYGDEMLSKLIAAYQPPELAIESTSGHQPNPVKGYFNVELGELFSFDIQARAGSGIHSISYKLIRTSGVSQEGIEAQILEGERIYASESGRVRRGSYSVSLQLPEKGIFTYRCEVVDQLDPIPGHVHRSEMLLTVIVG